MKTAAAVCAAILLLLTLSACSFSLKDKSKMSGEISFLYVDQGDPNVNEAFKKSKMLFEKQNPGVTVNLIVVNFWDYLDMMKQSSKSGNMPDVVHLGPSVFADAMMHNYVVDLTPFIQQNNIRMEDYYNEELIKAASVDGKLIGIPLGSDHAIVIYNKQLFEKAGIDYPRDDWTWEQFADTADKLSAINPGSGHYGAYFPITDYFLELLVAGKGGSLISLDGSTTQGYMDSPYAVENVSWLRELVRAKVIPNLIDLNVKDMLVYNQVGMLVGNYSWLSMFNNEEKKKIGIAEIPHFADGPPVNFVSSNTGHLGISTKAKNPELAWEFIRFFCMENNDLTQELSGLMYNSSKKVTQDEANALFSSTGAGTIHSFVKNAVYHNASWLMSQGTIRRGLGIILMTDEDIQTSLTNLALKVDAELKENSEISNTE